MQRAVLHPAPTRHPAQERETMSTSTDTSRSTDTRVPVVELDGASGLQRMRHLGRFAVPDPAGFRSTWRHATVDGVQLGEWSTSPISGAHPVDAGGPAVVLVRVAAGSVRYWSGGDVVDAPSGSIHLLNAADGVRFAVPEPSRIVRVMVPATLLPPEIRRATTAATGPMASTRITAGLTALVDQVLDPAVGGAASAAAGAIRPLAVAVIEDAVPDAAEQDLRGRIVEHIERRIGEPELGPQTIATEFGVSLRWVHSVFNVDGSSVARHIRERRLDLVAEQLRRDRRFPRIGALAEVYGFASRDQLTRSFKARYGVTIADSAVLAADGRAPSPAGDGEARTA
jgi:AraC-like DNA-binding protein